MEDLGIDMFCNMSLRKRDKLLLKVPKDELTCLFMGFEEDDILKCFSDTIIYKAFYKLPINDTLLLLSYIKVENMNLFLSDINERINCMSMNKVRFLEELHQHSDTLFILLESNIIKYDMIKARIFNNYILSDIATLFRTNKKFKKLGIHPLVYKLPFPTDLSLYIYSFL